MSLTKVSYSMIQGEVTNVLDYGADPTGVADSTTAIQSAIDATRLGTIYFPKGTYKVTDTINIGTDGTATALNLIGSQPEAPMAAFTWASIIDASSLGAKPLFEVGGLAFGCDSTAIVGLKLQGPGQNNSIAIKLTTYATAASYRSASDPGPLPEGSGAVIRVAHCMINEFSYGILGLSFLSNIEYNEIRGCSEGVVIWPYTNDLRVENNHFYNIADSGIDSQRFGNSAPGVQSGNMIFNANMFEAQGANCIDIRINNAIWTTVTNNVHGSGSLYGLYVENSFSNYDINWLSFISNKYQGLTLVFNVTSTFERPDYDQIVIQGNSQGNLILQKMPKIAGDIFNQFSSISTTDFSTGTVSLLKGQFPSRTPNINLITNGNFATNSGASYNQSNATYPYSGGSIPSGWTVGVSAAGVKLFWDVDGPKPSSGAIYDASGSTYLFDVRRDPAGNNGSVYFYQDITVEANGVYTVVALGGSNNTNWEIQICDTSNNVLARAIAQNYTVGSKIFATVSCNSKTLTTLRVRFITSDTNTGYMSYLAMYEGYWPALSIGYPN